MDMKNGSDIIAFIKRNKNKLLIILIIILVLLIPIYTHHKLVSKYNDAVQKIVSENFDDGLKLISELEEYNYKDSKFWKSFCEACVDYENGDYNQAYEIMANRFYSNEMEDEQIQFVDGWKNKIRKAYKDKKNKSTGTNSEKKEYKNYTKQNRTSSYGESKYKKTSKKSTTKRYTTKKYSKKRTTTKKKDPYNASDYMNPEDFYDDHYDDFFDYYDAEDYFNENN